ncbi:hypothetical protein DM860_016390 [Cuscuta australis]|uniref:Uncharacterized protein n=1 Tax=Cuscuta australis TaxID=267555 RepID=A0A328DF44_9ASTE|nr:hypothetical protein DM860_016390 [Cuscuta australis]
MNATSSTSSMSKETQKALPKAIVNLFKIHNACSFQQIIQDLRGLAREFQAAALCADAPPEELLSIVSQVAFNIQGMFVLKSSPENPQNDPLRKVIIDLFIAKGPTAKITNTHIIDAALLQLKRFITDDELWMAANELCVVQHKPWVWALKGVNARNIPSLDNTNTITKSSARTTNLDEQGSKAMNTTSSMTLMLEETQNALPKALVKLFKIHNTCSFQQIIQELRDMAREFQVAAMSVDAPAQELHSIVSQVAFNIHGMFVLKLSPEHLQNDPLRMVIIDLFYAKGPTAKLQTIDILKAGRLHLGWHILFKDMQMALYDLCIRKGEAWVLKGMDRSMKPLCPDKLSESNKVKARQGMTQWPLKIAKYVGDIEKGGQVLQLREEEEPKCEQELGKKEEDDGGNVASEMEHMPESIATFSRLRTLTLALDHGVGDIMFRIVQLLDSCPLLYGLSIVLSTREDKEHEKLESIDEYYNHHEHLEWIEIRGFVGTKYQIESCKCLLKLAPRAKSMILTFPLPALLSPSTEAGHRSHPLDKEERRSAVNALKAVSNDVKVFFI